MAEELYYPSSENKGADRLCSYCTADLCLCFCIDKNLAHRRTGIVLSGESKDTDQLHCWIGADLHLSFHNENNVLSYDVAVFQWIMSCNKKCYDHTCINTFAFTTPEKTM